MHVTPWSEILKQHRTPAQIAAIRARAKRMFLVVEFYPRDEAPTWVAVVHGAKANGATAQADTIGRARRRLRAALERAVGKRTAIRLWRDRAETMPAGAEEPELVRERRRRRVLARRRAARSACGFRPADKGWARSCPPETRGPSSARRRSAGSSARYHRPGWSRGAREDLRPVRALSAHAPLWARPRLPPARARLDAPLPARGGVRAPRPPGDFVLVVR